MHGPRIKRSRVQTHARLISSGAETKSLNGYSGVVEDSFSVPSVHKVSLVLKKPLCLELENLKFAMPSPKNVLRDIVKFRYCPQFNVGRETSFCCNDMITGVAFNTKFKCCKVQRDREMKCGRIAALLTYTPNYIKHAELNENRQCLFSMENKGNAI